LEVPLLKITGRNEDKENCDQSNGNEIKRKKIVLITSRIHPGEPHASYLAEGLIRFLISDDPNSKMLRKCFIFYIVPMLNPDGVIAGNFRTSYSGKDLNR
jgi:murein tripeptide amidase MpaA